MTVVFMEEAASAGALTAKTERAEKATGEIMVTDESRSVSAGTYMLFMGDWPSYLPDTAWLEMPGSAAESKNQSSTERSRRHGAQVGSQGMS